ncbi:MAG TPA: hypothetical protein VFO66_03245 [Gemmatimonadaceae bacterium]|nr:hypothetical protein [Gemmatimonadaceae bacterium]
MRSAVLAALCLLPAAAYGQARLVEGRVLRPMDGGEPRPVTGQWVVLHRVGADSAGPLDSARSGANGRFRFRYQASGSPDALYFVSASYGGIAYFSPPLRSASVSGGDADIIVHDTSTDTTRLRMQGRHIVVSQPRGTRREIAEIFDIENQSASTVVASSDVAPLWSTALPEAAESVAVAPGDVSAAAVQFTRGRAALFAPLSPGVRQLVLTYLLPNDAFPVAFPLQRPTSMLEILLEDPRGRVDGVALREVDAATIEGRTFRRLLAQDLAANAVVRIDMPAPPGQRGRVLALVIAAVATIMLLGLVGWLVRRMRAAPAPASSGSPGPSGANDLVAELAAMDARQERAGLALPEAEYRARRAELKARIEAALAAESRAS